MGCGKTKRAIGVALASQEPDPKPALGGTPPESSACSSTAPTHGRASRWLSQSCLSECRFPLQGSGLEVCTNLFSPTCLHGFLRFSPDLALAFVCSLERTVLARCFRASLPPLPPPERSQSIPPMVRRGVCSLSRSQPTQIENSVVCLGGGPNKLVTGQAAYEFMVSE